MEEGSEGDFLLHDQSSSPLPEPKLRRLRKVSQFGPRSPPAVPDHTPLPEAPLEPPETTVTLDFENPVPESDGIATEIDPELELDPLFSDLNQLETKRTEIGREEEDFVWGGGSGCATADEINDGIENAKSAKKRLILEGKCENTKKNKKRKSGEKPRESLREKRKLEKEREAQLVQIHAESQRLLRETRDASFKPVPLVQKPISSVLEKIRLRKIEVFKKSSVVNHSGSIDDITNCKADIYHDGEVTMPESKKEYDAGLEENKLPHDEEYLDTEGGGITTHGRDGHCNQVQVSNLNCDVANKTLGADEDSNESNEAEKDHKICYSTKEATRSTLSVLPTSFSELAPVDIVGPTSKFLKGDDNENAGCQPHKAFNMDSYSDVTLAKTFLDDEAEEEDDSDHDLMRFQENEEEDEIDDNEELTDMIATGFEEAPIDCERRNQLHQKWLEQQDTAATDNVLQRLRSNHKQKEPTLLHEEEASLEISEESDDEEPSDLPPTNTIHKSTKMAKQMMAKMFTQDDDGYLPSDDEEIEQSFIRQRLIERNKEPAVDSLIDDEHSREILGLIKNMNAVPETKKRAKSTSNFGLLMKESSNSSSKSSFLGRTTESSMQYSHKQSSSIARAFIFGRDDSNSRSSLPVSENFQEEDNLESKNKKPYAKFSGPQMKSNASTEKTESNTNSGSSLFEILRQSSMHFDKQLESKMSCDNTIETKAAHPFSAFKIQRKFSNVRQGLQNIQRMQ